MYSRGGGTGTAGTAAAGPMLKAQKKKNPGTVFYLYRVTDHNISGSVALRPKADTPLIESAESGQHPPPPPPPPPPPLAGGTNAK